MHQRGRPARPAIRPLLVFLLLLHRRWGVFRGSNVVCVFRTPMQEGVGDSVNSFAFDGMRVKAWIHGQVCVSTPVMLWIPSRGSLIWWGGPELDGKAVAPRGVEDFLTCLLVHQNPQPYGENWTRGDTISCVLDLHHGTIRFFRNGIDLGNRLFCFLCFRACLLYRVQGSSTRILNGCFFLISC